MNVCATESVFQSYYPHDLQLFNEQLFEELKDDGQFTKRLFLQQSPKTQRDLLINNKHSLFNPNVPPPGFSILKHSVTVFFCIF